MEIILFYSLAFVALIVGIAVVPMTFIAKTPISMFYGHYIARKPINWTILVGMVLWTFMIYYQEGAFPVWAILPITLVGFTLILAYKLHPENAFKAVDYPRFTEDISSLPIEDDREIAVIDFEGITKCYPLDYVIHHHIVNDNFGSKMVALTYCAMCRSVVPFDVTDLGPLFVSALKNGNMVMADRKTKTFFQQATFQSIIGKLHPTELTMIPFQVLSWADVKKTMPNPTVVKVSEKDFREFELPIPGAWRRVMSSELVPGISKKNRNTTFPARMRIIGVIDNAIHSKVAYLKKEVLNKGIVIDQEHDYFLVGRSNIVIAFKNVLNSSKLHISIEKDDIVDLNSETRWNMRGIYISGSLDEDLESIAITDEYWFSWKKFHNDSKLIRL